MTAPSLPSTAVRRRGRGCGGCGCGCGCGCDRRGRGRRCPSPSANRPTSTDASSAGTTEVLGGGTHLAGALRPPRWPRPSSVGLASLVSSSLLQGRGE